MTNRSRNVGAWGWVLTAGLVSAALGCTDDKVTPPIGQMCIQNSECKNPLSCTFGLCHSACVESRDCPTGQTCVTDKTADDEAVNICLLPKERECVRNSDCPGKFTCANDFICRNPCEADKDCTTKTQKCVENVCAEPDDFVKDPKTGELKLKPGTPPKDAGPRDDAGRGDAGMDASTPDKDASTPPKDAGKDAGKEPNMGPAEVEGITVDRPIVRQGEINVTITVVGKELRRSC
jgi:hypothetical protein